MAIRESEIKVMDLSWRIGDTLILKDIDLRIDKGRFVGIIGPNGSGKTTLLRNISAWFRPDEGAVLIEGENLEAFSDRELSKKMAFVKQNFNMDFEFTAMDLVLMGRSPYIPRFGSESHEDLDKTQRAMELTKVWDLRSRPVTALSGGELQRVMIARALVQETRILLMDEPISNLDINHQIQIMDLVKTYQQEKKLTVVAVLHDLNMAVQYCEEIILLHKGKVYKTGTPREVLMEESIKEVYGVDVHIMENPVTGLPLIIPISSMD